MAATLTVKIEGGEKLKKQLAKLNPKVNGRIFRASVREVATKIIANAKNVQIRRGGGRVHPTQLTHRHPGAGLGSSIGPDFGGLPSYAEVGTDIFYGAIHEYGGTFATKRGGTVTFPKRAFMAPALKAIRPEIPRIVVKHWKREAGL